MEISRICYTLFQHINSDLFALTFEQFLINYFAMKRQKLEPGTCKSIAIVDSIVACALVKLVVFCKRVKSWLCAWYLKIIFSSVCFDDVVFESISEVIEYDSDISLFVESNFKAAEVWPIFESIVNVLQIVF